MVTTTTTKINIERCSYEELENIYSSINTDKVAQLGSKYNMLLIQKSVDTVKEIHQFGVNEVGDSYKISKQLWACIVTFKGELLPLVPTEYLDTEFILTILKYSSQLKGRTRILKDLKDCVNTYSSLEIFCMEKDIRYKEWRKNKKSNTYHYVAPRFVSFPFVDKNLHTKEMVYKVLKNSPIYIQYVREDLITLDLIIYVFNKACNYQIANYIPEKYRALIRQLGKQHKKIHTYLKNRYKANHIKAIKGVVVSAFVDDLCPDDVHISWDVVETDSSIVSCKAYIHELDTEILEMFGRKTVINLEQINKEETILPFNPKSLDRLTTLEEFEGLKNDIEELKNDMEELKKIVERLLPNT